ncbi:hypothetical protein ACB496_15240 [Lelliottia nimipressuralis]|uniref:hypothetical protein n=1 Tax=Lelliottia nimipressuralis TaxID=69220 RepID=UPI003557C432
MSFEWDSNASQTYTENYGSRIIRRDNFDKQLGCCFTMDAPECELILKVNTTSKTAFTWPVATEYSIEKQTRINVQRGKLVISPERWVEEGIDGRTGEHENPVYITVSEGAELNIENIDINASSNSGRCIWDVAGTLIMDGGDCRSPAKLNIRGNGFWRRKQEYMNLQGDYVIDSSPVNGADYSCLLSAGNFYMGGIEYVEDYASFLIKGDSRVKISIEKQPGSEYIGGINIKGWLTLQDTSKLTISNTQRNGEFNITGGFNLKGTAAEVYFGEAGKSCPIILESGDLKTGRYNGVFNFITHKSESNKSAFIFVNAQSDFINLLYQGEYVTINGDTAVPDKQYIARFYNLSPGIQSVVVVLK